MKVLRHGLASSIMPWREMRRMDLMICGCFTSADLSPPCQIIHGYRCRGRRAREIMLRGVGSDGFLASRMFDDTKKAGMAYRLLEGVLIDTFRPAFAISTKTVVDTTSISLDSETS
jgi:hypothetical protein